MTFFRTGIVARRFFICMLLTAALLLTGCSSGTQAAALGQYSSQMDTFFDELADCRDEYEAIDENADDAGTQLLAVIDKMAACVSDAASVEAPEEYANVRICAENASKYMDQSKQLFHKALDDPSAYDAESFKEAQEYYATANQRIGYMVSFLHGETPEGVTVTYEETPDAASAYTSSTP